MLSYIFSILLLISVNSFAKTESAVPYYAPNKQLPFVIHICSFNNKPWVSKNLDSVLMQRYDNYRIIYVDDLSDDGTADAVTKYINKHNLSGKVTLVANKVRCRKMKNMYSTIRLCDDHEIIVQLDGDDWFCDDQLLARLNHIYQTQDVWLTYGSYRDYPSNKKGYCAPTPDEWVTYKSFRNEKWVYMPTRSFYAWLFKAIKVQDLISELVKEYESAFFPSSDDLASYWPMIEMAGNRFAYLPEINYIANRGNPLCGKIFESPLQKACRLDVRKRPPYETLLYPSINQKDQLMYDKADVVIISQNNPLDLAQSLSSFQKYLTGIGQITVLYDTDVVNCSAYTALQTEFPAIIFTDCTSGCVYNELVPAVTELENAHILVARAGLTLMHENNLTPSIQELEETKAYGIYFAFSSDQEPFYDTTAQQRALPFVHLYDDMYSWKFSCGKFALFNNMDATLLRKKDLLARISDLGKNGQAQTIQEFYATWQKNSAIEPQAIGLFCKKSPFEGDRTSITTPLPLPKYKSIESLTRNIILSTIDQ